MISGKRRRCWDFFFFWCIIWRVVFWFFLWHHNFHLVLWEGKKWTVQIPVWRFRPRFPLGPSLLRRGGDRAGTAHTAPPPQRQHVFAFQRSSGVGAVLIWTLHQPGSAHFLFTRDALALNAGAICAPWQRLILFSLPLHAHAGYYSWNAWWLLWLLDKVDTWINSSLSLV